MTACDDVDLILAVGAAGGGFQSDEIETVRSHLKGCRRCSEAAAAYTATADLLAIAVEQVPPPERLRTRIMAEVYATAPAATRARRSEPAATLRGRLAGLWRTVPSGRGFTLGGGLAVAAAVALLVVAVTRGGGTGPVSSPLSGPIGGPAVQGSFTYYAGTQTAVLDVHGLAPLQSTGVYEVWLVRSSSGVTPAGYLTEQPDGSWTVAIHGSIAGYATVAATSESGPGHTRPAGDVVLSGNLPAT